MEIEPYKRFKDSMLWRLQHEAYQQFGPDAWAIKGVPFYLTSNPLLARQFCHVILGYIRDVLPTINKQEPFYIFDLGAGSGRLGYLILKILLPIVRETIGEDLKICYVMTDMVKTNLKFWEKHPSLKPYVEAGSLDFAIYHHSRTTPLKLEKKGITLNNGALANPAALICTYYFDTVPQDYFRVDHGRLEEGRVAIHLSDDGESVDPTHPDPEWIMKLETRYQYHPVDQVHNYYPDRQEYDRLLQYYLDLFEEASFLFPIGGLETLRYFSRLAGGRLLLLAGDQGASTKAQILDWGEPKIARHASFSMPVSYHLLAKYFEMKGGTGLLTTHPQPKFVVMAGVLGGRVSYTRLAFEEEIDFFEPVEYWKLTDLNEESLEAFSLEQLLLLIKLGNWDPVNFHFFFPYLMKKISSADKQEKDFLAETVERVWDHFYPVSSLEAEFVKNLGTVLTFLGRPDRAKFFFDKANSLKFTI